MSGYNFKGKKIVILLALIVVAFFGLKYFVGFGKKAVASVEVEKGSFAGAPAAQQNPNVQKLSLPESQVYYSGTPQIRIFQYAWNPHMGAHYANGGPVTTKNSIYAKLGMNVKFTRQDDNGMLMQELYNFAEDLQTNPQPTRGATFITFMGDAAAMQFFKPLSDKLKVLGPEYRPVIIGTFGRSNGEDKFMGPIEWKNNPKAAIGALISTVVRDGDWNIVVQWCSDNDIPVNPDISTYDPDAVNFLDCKDYIESAKKYIDGYKESRKVVKKGKLTGDTKEVVVTGTSTWTPADVNVAEQKGGLISIVSTKEYSGQMPTVIVGIEKWCKANPTLVEKLLDGAFQGADQINKFPDAFKRGGEISDQIYGENKGGSYWCTYYRGKTQTDAKNLMVSLGGSYSHNLADNLLWFGLTSGGTNVYKAVYTRFAEVCKKMYPNMLPDYPPAEQICDLSYLKSLQSKAGNVDMSTTMPKYTSGSVSEQVGKRSWNINFNTGQATFTSSAYSQLEEMSASLLNALDLKVEIHGYTDNVGDYNANMDLSRRRAQAVADYLKRKSVQLFGSDRVNVQWHGPDDPKADNSTAEGRATNRRVDIITGR